MPYTKEQAHSEYLDVFGSKYEFLKGPKTGEVVEVRKYELSNDGNSLYFIMSNNVKIDAKQFYDIMLSVGLSERQDPLFAAKSGATVTPAIEEKLGIMSDEEELQLNERIKQRKNNKAATDNKPNNVKKSDNPIDLILLKRKNKIKVEIPIHVELEFIDKNTFDLINSTFDDATDGIVNFFMNNIDTEFMKKNFEKSIRKHIAEQFLNTEYVEEQETQSIAEDPESGITEVLKWEDSIVKVSEDINTSEEEEFVNNPAGLPNREYGYRSRPFTWDELHQIIVEDQKVDQILVDTHVQ